MDLYFVLEPHFHSQLNEFYQKFNLITIKCHVMNKIFVVWWPFFSVIAFLFYFDVLWLSRYMGIYSVYWLFPECI